MLHLLLQEVFDLANEMQSNGDPSDYLPEIVRESELGVAELRKTLDKAAGYQLPISGRHNGYGPLKRHLCLVTLCGRKPPDDQVEFEPPQEVENLDGLAHLADEYAVNLRWLDTQHLTDEEARVLIHLFDAEPDHILTPGDED